MSRCSRLPRSQVQLHCSHRRRRTRSYDLCAACCFFSCSSASVCCVRAHSSLSHHLGSGSGVDGIVAGAERHCQRQRRWRRWRRWRWRWHWPAALLAITMLRFRGSTHFRQRLLLSTLSGRAIRIDDIRADDQSPGLRDYEACLLRLLEKLTNGCVVEINETGTSLRYSPGVIVCGGGLSHECSGRAIGFFLEPLVLLALFAKKVRTCM